MIRNILHSGQVSVATRQKTNATDAIDPKHKTTPAMQQTHRCYVNHQFELICYFDLYFLILYMSLLPLCVLCRQSHVCKLGFLSNFDGS